MTTWCKVEGGVITQRVNVRKAPTGIAIVDGEPVWRQFFQVDRPIYDNTTHHPPVLSEVIQPTQVWQSWSTPVAKTAGELDAEKTSKATSIAGRNEIKVVKLIMTGQFFLINEIRALQSKVPIDIDQYFSALDGLSTISDAKFIARIKSLL